MITVSVVNAQSSIEKKESARIFVQKFYDEYFKIYNSGLKDKNGTYIDATAYIIKQKQQCFNDRLLMALKQNDSINYISFPFLSPLADYDKSNYQTGNVVEYGEDFFIDVHSGLIGASKQNILNNPVAIIIEVMNIHNHWEIVNFKYPSPNGDNNFLASIKQYKLDIEEFRKNPKASE